MARNSDTDLTELPGWGDYLAKLRQSEDLRELLEDPDDRAQLQDFYELLVKSFTAGFFSAVSDPDYPDFVPSVNTVHNTVGVNPDFIYGYTRVNGEGTYRLSGKRGDGLFVMFDFIAGGMGVMDELGPSMGTLDLDDLELGPDGEFDVLLSPQRPPGYNGQWRQLRPETRTINVRQASYDWGAGREPRIAIERVDIPLEHRPAGPVETARRLERLMEYPLRYAGFALKHMKNQRDRGLYNQLEYDDWAGRGGVAGQYYYQGLFDLGEDEALILETDLPETVRYWNIQLTDRLWNSVSWLNHQSSLNGGQAVLDGDGRFRAVISIRDPGVPNWLDPAGRGRGFLMLRWNEASSGPPPALRVVPFDRVRQELPADTPSVSFEERQEQLRARRRSVQFRRRW